MDTGKIVIGIACIMLSAGMLISPSSAAVLSSSHPGPGSLAGYSGPAACTGSGYGSTLSTPHPALSSPRKSHATVRTMTTQDTSRYLLTGM